MSTHSFSVGRALNMYGLDHSPRISGDLSQSIDKVFVKKDMAGKYDFDHGAYISKKNEYGQFRWLNPRGLIKYQTSDLVQVDLSKKNLQELQKTYKNARVPPFLVNLLKGRDVKPLDPVYADVYKKNPSAFYYSPSLGSGNGFLIYPNIPYMSENYTNNRHKELSSKREGIQLLAWAIHPTLPQNFIEEITGNTSKKVVVEESTFETIQKLAEEKSGEKSLTSILDLDHGDIDLLENLKANVTRHLSDAYGVLTEADNINLFFHFPVATSTATLHLHVWVNKGDHPLNESRAFGIDEVIQHLKGGKDIESLVLSRNDGRFILPQKDRLHELQGMPEPQAPTREARERLSLPLA
ncbi:hypothetical protein [Burkholderia ubonensis]|uniref:hypothetical protein n=1 Tax=Burkholderia ubonensis TaxID=101571 RepID=UPI0012FCEC91|nr:hypothetical protein [Burkholderia ubonensis]